MKQNRLLAQIPRQSLFPPLAHLLRILQTQFMHVICCFLLRYIKSPVSVSFSEGFTIMASGSSSQSSDHNTPQHPLIMPSPLPEPMTPRTSWIDQQQTPLGFTPGSANPPASSLMPPPSAPPSHALPSPSPSSLPSSSYPSSASPMSPSTPLSTAESVGIVPQLQNIVSTVNLGCKLDLKKIALHARNAEYNPKRFAAVIMRIRDPRTTALVFSSGKMVCTGAKSEELSRLAARKYARIIQKLGFPARFMEFKIQNMVGSCDVKFPIRLEGLVIKHGQFSSYEPELFPGLIYRMVRPRIVLLIFVSGKVVLTGAKERSEIIKAFNNIYPILKKFKKS